MSTATTTSSIYRPTASSSSSLRQAAIKKNMSITQTYYLAHKARAKLSREAAQPDHDLRLLVGHANLLDSLMLELADAEREQERWFNQSVRGANSQQDRHVQWADNITEEDEDDYDSDSSDSSDYESEDEDVEMANATPIKAMTPRITHVELDEDMEEDDLEEDYAQLELVRTPSHSNSPPELVDHDSDSDSDSDDSMPPSPPQPTIDFNQKEAKEQSQEKQQQDESDAFFDEDYYLPPRNPARLVSAISVY